MLHLLSLVRTPHHHYHTPHRMLRRTNPSTCKHSLYTKCHPLMCVISRIFFSSGLPISVRFRASSKRSSSAANIFQLQLQFVMGLKNSYIHVIFLIVLKDVGKSLISSLLEPLKGLNRSMDLVTVWFASRAIELCSLYNVNVPKRYHPSTY